MAHWTASDIPSQSGRTAVITGTGGLGYEDALALARAGATVVLAGRNATKGAESVRRILRAVPEAQVRFAALDLASLKSIEAFGQALRGSMRSLDLLINNAGVMTPPRRQETRDGFELQLGTNHLGHFALTAALLPLLRKGDKPRVVSVSSVAARRNAAIRFDDMQWQRKYDAFAAYRQSKLACLMFALELQRRSDAAGWGIQSIAAHPGVSRTDLLPNGSGERSFAGLMRRYMWFLFQPASQGALPTLFAATSPHARGGAYYGPDQFGETRGFPAAATVPAEAQDASVATRLWNESERLTGTTFAHQGAPASARA